MTAVTVTAAICPHRRAPLQGGRSAAAVPAGILGPPGRARPVVPAAGVHRRTPAGVLGPHIPSRRLAAIPARPFAAAPMGRRAAGLTPHAHGQVAAGVHAQQHLHTLPGAARIVQQHPLGIRRHTRQGASAIPAQRHPGAGFAPAARPHGRVERHGVIIHRSHRLSVGLSDGGHRPSILRHRPRCLHRRSIIHMPGRPRR